MKHFEVGKVYKSDVCTAEIEITKRMNKMLEYTFANTVLNGKYRAKIRHYENLEYIIILLGRGDVYYYAVDVKGE